MHQHPALALNIFALSFFGTCRATTFALVVNCPKTLCTE